MEHPQEAWDVSSVTGARQNTSRRAEDFLHRNTGTAMHPLFPVGQPQGWHSFWENCLTGRPSHKRMTESVQESLHPKARGTVC
jgi:hypothetical protein